MASALPQQQARQTHPVPVSRPGRARVAVVHLLVALPLIALAVWAARRGYTDPGLRLLEHRAGLVKSGGRNLAGVRYGYPPLPIILALAVPAGPLGLSILTCLFSVATIYYLARRLRGRLPVATTLALIMPVAVVPAMWYMTTQLLAPVIALTFLAIALDGFVQFAAFGKTEGGFAAGLALTASYCADPGALLYGAVMCAFAPLISHARYHAPGATAGVTAVLFFPMAAFAAGWSFLIWKFAGTFPGSLDYAPGAHVLAFPGGLSGSLANATRSALLALLHTPLYAAAGIVILRRGPAAAAGLLLPVIALIAGLWLGFAYPGIDAYYMLTLLALTVISHTPSHRIQSLLITAALAQTAIGVLWPPATPGFGNWTHALFS